MFFWFIRVELLRMEVKGDRGHNLEIIPINLDHPLAEEYRSLISMPLTLQNHTQPYDYHSNSKGVKQRTKAFCSYLKNPCINKYTWGRTIFSESALRALYHRVMQKILQKYGVSVLLAPTSLDESNEQQKGTDVCFVSLNRYDPIRRGHIYNPILGIDFTIGDEEVVERKRRKRPPINKTVAMPVGVISAYDLYMNSYYDFVSHMDEVAAPMLLKTGQYDPFIGLTEDEIFYLQRNALYLLKEALTACHDSLVNPNVPQVTDYAYMGDVFYKLNFMNKLVEEAGQMN
jgi:hypothetical protein